MPEGASRLDSAMDAPLEPALFAVGDIVARTLGTADVPTLQAFFADNAAYFLAVHGEPARHDEARLEFEDRPPPEMPFDRVFVVGFSDADGRLVAMASVIENLLARHVWHIGLFIVTTPLHGRGVAQRLHSGLEGWMKAQGARWIRLGVVCGNARAERFWQRCGYTEVRQRHDVQLGRLSHTVRVMVKPVGGRSLADYLGRVPRDQPASLLP